MMARFADPTRPDAALVPVPAEPKGGRPSRGTTQDRRRAAKQRQAERDAYRQRRQARRKQ
jgi:hypothetical protein